MRIIRAWPEQEEKLLRLLVEEGKLSGRQIGLRLGRTRNAILGKIDRMNLRPNNHQEPSNVKTCGGEPPSPSSRAEAKQQTHVAAMPPGRRGDALQPPLAASRLPHSSPVFGAVEATLALSVDVCRWPIGDPASPEFHYCCEPRDLALSPYCAGHRKIGGNGYGSSGH